MHTVISEQEQYLKKLDDLMTDEEAVSMQNLGLLLVGPPSVGKTTTLSRLLKDIVNITSDKEKAKLGKYTTRQLPSSCRLHKQRCHRMGLFGRRERRSKGPIWLHVQRQDRQCTKRRKDDKAACD